MPIHQFVNDSFLQEKGLSNYWGYNTIGFFAPHNAYSSSGQRGEAGATNSNPWSRPTIAPAWK